MKARLEKEIVLQAVKVGDAEEIVAALENASLDNFSWFEEPPTVERERDYLVKLETESSHLYLIRNSEGRLVGTVGLHEIDEINRTARIGLIIFQEEDRSSGYGYRAMCQMINTAFDHLGIEKIYANVIATNIAQIEWDKALGFEQEGYLKAEYFLRGERHDMVRLALLKSKWKGK